jgi:hypothetical protein
MKMEERIGCLSCPDKRFSRALGRCIFGKVNPRTLKGAKQCVAFMGKDYICQFNRFRREGRV